MKGAAIIGIVALALAATVLRVGFLLPKKHIATRSALYHRPAEDVYAVIAGPPDWRPDVKSWEELPLANGHQRRKETTGDATLTLEVLEDNPPHRRVTRLADKDLPFGGDWIYEIETLPNGSRLRITERGEIYNPVYRFVSRFFLGYTGSIERYLVALGRKFGETTSVDP